jgi:hypothetical protein
MKAAYQTMREKNKRETCYTRSNMTASLIMAEIFDDDTWLGGERGEICSWLPKSARKIVAHPKTNKIDFRDSL